MQKDVRETLLYREAEALYGSIRKPGTGQISDAAEIHVSPDGKQAVFAGAFVEKLEGTPITRVCQIDLESADIRIMTLGPNTDRLPKYSPDGRQIAFLSDRHMASEFQLYLLDPITGAARSVPSVNGWVEYFRWSPDGKQILLGVAGHGADVAGVQGAVTNRPFAEEAPSWMPDVNIGKSDDGWRSAWVYELATDGVRQVGHADSNIWEAVWCGNGTIAAVVSPGSSEGLWYSARLQIVDIHSGKCKELYVPQDQLGWPAASPSGKYLAIVEAVCSDRWIVAGSLRLIDSDSGNIQKVDTGGVEITFTEWRSDSTLLLAGHRGFETVVGLYEAASGTFTEVWRSEEITTGGIYISVSGLNDSGDCVLVGENFHRAPEIAVIREGNYHTIRSFNLGYAREARVIDSVERVNWNAPDGLALQGWLLRPNGKGPYPLVMSVHGGPVWQWRPLWLGRGSASALMLVKRGYAVFFPNPRGSTGRGRDFTLHVLGDMGGADTFDYLSGLDHLVNEGVADPTRLGVTGISYGGFMTSWLITQDARFAAAVPVAPVTNQVTEHLISNIPDFVSLFLADVYTNTSGKYFQRSPIMYANKAKTPTLNVCGALDRCTPPGEALQFHNALLENGVKSVLITYPEEGHGVRRWPAAIDYAARVVGWFEEHMSANSDC